MGRLRGPRLRMLLEAAEDVARTDMSEGVPCPHNLTIEHVMPQAWREYWGSDLRDDASRLRRDQVIQTLGNLTLVTRRLNPSLSNRPGPRRRPQRTASPAAANATRSSNTVSSS
ncbi:MAG: hypothetical protein QOE61_4737 [Micromonosporaceae bacterium]|jgi:hypothetical protein|nr:hypothetical protein [Micromonosporaceae bacterium]